MAVKGLIPRLIIVIISAWGFAGRKKIINLYFLGKFCLIVALVYTSIVILITTGILPTVGTPLLIRITEDTTTTRSIVPLAQIMTQKQLKISNNASMKDLYGSSMTKIYTKPNNQSTIPPTTPQLSTTTTKASTIGIYGWTYDANLDTKIYVKPNQATTIYEPKKACQIKNKEKKLFILVIVCSSVNNFDRRQSIRESWGNYSKFIKHFDNFVKVREKYKDYDYKNALYPLKIDVKRKTTLAGQLQNQNINKTVPERNSTKNDEIPEFRLLFLMGILLKENNTIQKQLQDEIAKYDDVIQEEFVDSYNNLTIKSIIMLKWLANKCNDSARYILKTDDDTYINVPQLVLNLKKHSEAFDKKRKKRDKEYLLLGDLIRRAKPIKDPTDKWFCPNYLYSGKTYPNYLSGMAYVMSMPTALVLYAAALRTNYFHLEDIFITGICASKANPPVKPRGDSMISLVPVPKTACATHNQITVHRMQAAHMRAFHSQLMSEAEVDKCERIRLTRIRGKKMKKLKSKKPKKTAGTSSKPTLKPNNTSKPLLKPIDTSSSLKLTLEPKNTTN